MQLFVAPLMFVELPSFDVFSPPDRGASLYILVYIVGNYGTVRKGPGVLHFIGPWYVDSALLDKTSSFASGTRTCARFIRIPGPLPLTNPPPLGALVPCKISAREEK